MSAIFHDGKGDYYHCLPCSSPSQPSSLVSDSDMSSRLLIA